MATLFTRRAALLGAGGLFGGLLAPAQNPYGRPGMSCTGYDQFGLQTCTTGIPTEEIEPFQALQANSQWCWAASIQMIFTYYGLRISQQRIVQETFGMQVNLPAQKFIILRELNRDWQANGRFSVRSDFANVSPDVAAWELLAKRPLIVGTMGHCMVMTAMTYRRAADGSGQPLQFVVRDPWPGNGGRRALSPQEAFGLNEMAGGICLRVAVS